MEAGFVTPGPGLLRSLNKNFMLDMFAVIGRELFSSVDPKRFGSMAKALITLFQLITLDDWFYIYSDIVNADPGKLLCIYILIILANL